MIRCYLALGSNLNQPEKQIEAAVRQLEKLPESQVVNQSSLYETTPLDESAQNAYINAAVCVDTYLTPDKLQHHCQIIENRMGKIKLYHWGPRTIDIDIILYGNMQVIEDDLTIPHPGILERDFVIEPLLEMNADIALPDGRLLKEFRSQAKKTIIRKLEVTSVSN